MVKERVGNLAWLRKRVEEADREDLLREMVKAMAEALMSAEADSVCKASYGKRSLDRVNQHNGYRTRRWDTRAGTVDLGIPKLRKESYFPAWLLEPRVKGRVGFLGLWSATYPRPFSSTCCLATPPFLPSLALRCRVSSDAGNSSVPSSQ